jgi:hypothetical protein
MFQAYIDETLGESPHGVFVMGGFISTAEAWAAFSDEWQQHLDYRSAHYRKLESFHYREMRSEADKERCRWFYRVAHKYARGYMAIAINMAAMKRVCDEFEWPKEAAPLAGQLRNPRACLWTASGAVRWRS